MANKQGPNVLKDFVVGAWNSLILTKAAGSAAYLMGAIDNGALEVTRDVYRYMTNHNIRRVGAVYPIKVGMNFKGVVLEHHISVWNALMNIALDATGYPYP